jgi:hypothetical protein
VGEGKVQSDIEAIRERYSFPNQKAHKKGGAGLKHSHGEKYIVPGHTRALSREERRLRIRSITN